MDITELDEEQFAVRDRTEQQQTVETFLEFARQRSLSSGIPRLQSVSYQCSPFLARRPARLGLLTLSSERQPTQVAEPPSPLLSPSAITPEAEDSESVPEVFTRASRRPRSHSDSEPFPSTPDPAAFQRTLQSIREMSGLQVQSSHQRAVLVARKLQAIADDYNRTTGDDQPRCSLWDVITNALGCPHRDIVDQFALCMKRLHYDDFSWKFVVRFFMVGFRLLESLSSKNAYEEQQSKLLGIFLDFLNDKLSKWVEDQGGWESFSSEVQVTQDLGHASKPNAMPSPRFPCQLERIPSEREARDDIASETTSTSTPPCSRQPLVCHLPNSVASMTTGPGRSRAVSVPARPTSLSLPQNRTSHSFPNQESSFLQGNSLSHDDAATATRRSSSSSTTNQLLFAGLAFSFGVALGSFLTQIK